MKNYKISKEVISKLNQLEFGVLRELIDNCLRLEEENISLEMQSLFTTDLEILIDYTDFLETKIISLPIPPKKFVSSFQGKELDLIFAKIKENKSKIETSFNTIKQKELNIKTLERKKHLSIKKRQQRIVIQEKSIQDLKDKIDLLKYETHRLYQETPEAVKAKEEFLEEYNEYLKAVEEYKINLKRHQFQCKILERLCREINEIKHLGFKFNKLSWKLLPKGKIPFRQFQTYLKQQSNQYDNEVDYEKIERIYRLVNPKYDRIYCGSDEFEGYLVFYFERKQVAVLDCPKKGNAIYIFNENWKTLTRLSKSELLNYYPHKTVRIIHKGDWFERLVSYLDGNY